jgi:hypothetical protein
VSKTTVANVVVVENWTNHERIKPSLNVRRRDRSTVTGVDSTEDSVFLIVV